MEISRYNRIYQEISVNTRRVLKDDTCFSHLKKKKVWIQREKKVLAKIDFKLQDQSEGQFKTTSAIVFSSNVKNMYSLMTNHEGMMVYLILRMS